MRIENLSVGQTVYDVGTHKLEFDRYCLWHLGRMGMNEFDKWWSKDGDGTPDFHHDEISLAREAWDAAVIAAAGCIVTDGNPDNARMKILELLSSAKSP